MSSIHQNFLDRKNVLESELGEPVSINGLTGQLRIFQRLGGHRHSIDDATTAWYALQKKANADEVLDLGAGIGSVGLITLWGLSSSSKLTSIEAQEVSYKLLRTNVECNGLNDRVRVIHGDLRDLNLDTKFRLITGSPPYFPLSTGVLPTDSQKAHARFELRGDVGDYARAAKRHLHEDGVFIFCFPFQQKHRCLDLVSRAGLQIMTIRDVIPRPSKPALFSLYSAIHFRPPARKPIQEPSFFVHSESGSYTPEMIAMQWSREFGPDGTNKVDL